MNVSLEYDVWISFLDVIMVILMLIGAYKGYTQGAVVQSVALLALLVGLTICVTLAKSIHRYLTPRSDVPDLFAIVVLALIFVAAIYATAIVSRKVRHSIEEAPLGTTNRLIGIALGSIKYFFIAAVYLLVLFKVEEHAEFLPDREKFSKMSRLSISVVTGIFPYLKMEKKNYSPYKYPDNNSDSDSPSGDSDEKYQNDTNE